MECSACTDCGQFVEIPGAFATTEIKMAGGVYVKSYTVAKADTYLPQHSHAYDHISYIAAGAVRAWADGVDLGEFVAPIGIVIRADTKHLFRTMEDRTVLLCIHNIGAAEGVEVLDEHRLSMVGSDAN